MVIILAKLGSNINYGQGKGTVLTSPMCATPDMWEGDTIVDKAQFYKLNLHNLSHHVTKGTELIYTHSMHHHHARCWFQAPAPSDCYPLHYRLAGSQNQFWHGGQEKSPASGGEIKSGCPNCSQSVYSLGQSSSKIKDMKFKIMSINNQKHTEHVSVSIWCLKFHFCHTSRCWLFPWLNQLMYTTALTTFMVQK